MQRPHPLALGGFTLCVLMGGFLARDAFAITCKHESSSSTVECIAPQWGPWSYDSGNHHSGGINHPPVDTLEEAASNARLEIAAYFGSAFCSFDYRITSVPFVSWHSSAGISDIESIWYYMEGTAWYSGLTPCGMGQGERVQINRTRKVFCPSGWNGSWSAEQGWFCFREYHSPRCVGQCNGSAATGAAPSAEGPQNTRDPGWIGNGLYVHTLDKYQSEVDWSSGGVRPFSLRRNYLSTGFPRLPQVPRVDDGLGGYWRTTFNVRLESFANATTTSKVAMRNDGSTLYFYRSGNAWTGRPEQTAGLVDLYSGSTVAGWRLSLHDDSYEDYDVQGRLVAIVERGGWRYDLAYDSPGRLASVVDSLGRRLDYSYTAAGALQSIATPDGPLHFHFDTRGYLASVTYPDGSVRQYKYMEPGTLGSTSYTGLLTGIVDENSSRFSTVRYDSAARAWQIENGNGVNRYSISWTGGTNVTDPLGTTRLYSKTPIKGFWRTTGLSQPCPACGDAANASTIAYDAVGNVVSRTTFTGRKSCYAYDANRNLETARIEGLAAAESCSTALATPPSRPDVRKVSTAWHPTLRLPATLVEPAPGGTRTTSFTYDAAGNLVRKSIVAPKNDGTSATIARAWSWTYGTFGRVLTATDPNGMVTTTTYHSDADVDPGRRGQVASITDPLGHVTQYNAYDKGGRLTSTTDPNGLVSTMTYDVRGRLTSRTVGGEVTTYDYDPAGQLTGVELPDGAHLGYVYDAAHRLAEIRDGLDNKIVYALDGMGNRTREEAFDPAGMLARSRSRVYDSLNRLSQEIGAQGQTTVHSYDGHGNRLATTDPLNHATASSYDSLNRVLTVTQPGGPLTQYAYDKTNNLASVTDPRGLSTSYGYDGLGNQVSLASPDTGVTAHTHDAGGNVLTSLDARGVTSTYAYDNKGRTTRIVYSKAGFTSEAHTFTWDGGATPAPNAKGRLTQMTDPSGTTKWTYTPHGRVATRQQISGSITLTTGYSWANGRMIAMTTPSGQQIGYAWSNGRIVGVTLNGSPLIADGSYEPFGPLSAWQWSNGRMTYRDHDTDGRLVTWEFRNGSSIIRRDITFDLASRIIGIADPADSRNGSRYGYDVLDRLTSAVTTGTPPVSRGYDYDAIGNRTRSTIDAATTVYGYGPSSNRLNSLSGAIARTYVYDGAGNPTQVGNLAYGYNLANRMASVSSGASAIYKVNALGERVAKSLGTSTTRYVYDERGHLLGEYAANGALIQENVWLDDLPIATLRPTGTGTPTPVAVYFVHADHLGSPRAVTRPSDDTLMWAWDNDDPFGITAPNESPAGQVTFRYDLRLPGQLFDVETGTNYNFFRDYDPVTGRFTQSDPIGLQGGLDTYVYADNSSVNKSDRYGLDTCGSGYTEGFVPDNPLTFPFSYCCRRHDNCYDNCFTMPSKEECDENFCLCTYNRCAKLSYASGVRLLCERWARAYCSAVTWRGQAAFVAARRECTRCK